MAKKKRKIYDPTHLITTIEKWTLPFYDKKHGYYIYVEGRTRSNQTRIEHIVEHGHDLKARDLELVPNGISDYFEYKKDPLYKNTFNYYIKRKGRNRTQEAYMRVRRFQPLGTHSGTGRQEHERKKHRSCI